MSVPKHRKSKSAVRTKRSHHALKKTTLGVCSNCKKPIKPHHACEFCGYYKGRKVLNTKTDVLQKREDKRKKKEEKQKKKERLNK